jgi:hypothetical protein
MSQAISSMRSSSAEPVVESLGRRVVTGSRMSCSRVIGVLFLAGFLLYGVGFSLVTSVIGAPGFLSTISASPTILVLGAFLMLLNTAVDVGKAVLFFPILEKHGRRTALGYLATMIVEVVFLGVGALCLLMLVPLSGQHGVDAGVTKLLASLAVQANFMAYQLGEGTLAFGALFLCSLLLRTRLIPRWLSISGLFGYGLLLTGCVAEIFGIHIGIQLTVPGMFFELALPFWLFFKGFQTEAYGGPSAVKSAA